MNPFADLYEKNKDKWAREDCKTAQYAYRVQYNVPRTAIELTDTLTEYEFEYELILRFEYNEYLKYMRSNDRISLDQGGFDRDLRTDPELYENMKEKIEAGEKLDFNLPDDSNVPRLSTLSSIRKESDLERVDPEEVFGIGGG